MKQRVVTIILSMVMVFSSMSLSSVRAQEVPRVETETTDDGDEYVDDEYEESIYVEIDEENSVLDVPYGQAATVKISVSPKEASELSYHWSAYEIFPTHKVGEQIEIEADGDTCIIPSVTKYMQVQCSVEDQMGNWDSAYTYVGVDTNLSIDAVEDCETYYDGIWGGNTAFKAVVSCNPDVNYSYSWKKEYNEENGDFCEEWLENTTDTLELEDIHESATYNCFVTDEYGRYDYIPFVTDPQIGFECNIGSQATIYQGSKFYFEDVITILEELPDKYKKDLEYQWYQLVMVDGERSEYVPIEGANSENYITDAIEEESFYRLEIRNQYGLKEEFDFDIYPTTGASFEMMSHSYLYYTYGIGIGDKKGVNGVISDTLTAEPGAQYKAVWYELNGEQKNKITENLFTVPEKGKCEVALEVLYDKKRTYICEIYRADDTEYKNQEAYAKFVAYIETGLSSSYWRDPIKVKAGDSVTLTAFAAIDEGYQIVSYEWFEMIPKEYIYQEDTYIPLDNGKNQTITFKPERTGWYICKITDSEGNQVSDRFSIELEGEWVGPKPIIPSLNDDDKKVQGNPVPKTNVKSVIASNGYSVTTTQNGEATLKTVKAKASAKSITVASTVLVDNFKYTITTIDANAFKNARKATTVVLPNTITKIQAKAFKGSKITTVKLTVNKGKTLTINKNAFKGSKVKKVTLTVSKKAKSAEIKKLTNQLKRAGISVKNIKIKKK